MEELRLAFLVFGACAIAAILAHGLWSVRKNTARKTRQNYQPRSDAEVEADANPDAPVDMYAAEAREYDDMHVIEADIQSAQQPSEPAMHSAAIAEENEQQTHYDDLGLGPVRVVGKNSENKKPEEQTAENGDVSDDDKPSHKVYASVVTQPKPEYAALQKKATESRSGSAVSDIPEPPPSLLKKEPVANAIVEAQESPSAEPEIRIDTYSVADKSDEEEKPLASRASLADQAKKLVKRKKSNATSRKRREPRLREDQMAIDFNEPEHSPQTDKGLSSGSANGNPPSTSSDTDSSSALQQEVLVLNVKAPDDKPIQGAALLPMLLTLGFKFGEQDIFHRHVNSNGKGPVLFSLANMFKPGVFDIDNLENFTTQGVSLFMILPIEGDPHQVFNMMHNAARKLADEFNAQVLDGRRSILTKQSLQQCIEKIREFERQRMIAR